MTTAKTLTFEDIVTFPYPLHKINDNLFMFHDRSQFRDSVIELISEFQQRIERPVVIMDGLNNLAIDEQTKLIQQFPNVFFLMIPNQDASNLGTFSEDSNWWSFTGRDSSQYLINQWKYFIENTSSYLMEEREDYEYNNYQALVKVTGIKNSARKLLSRGWKNSLAVLVNSFTNIVSEETNLTMVKFILDSYWSNFYVSNKEYFNLSKEERAVRNIAKKFNYFIVNRFDKNKYRIKNEIKSHQQTIREIYRRANTLEKEISDKNILLRSLSSKITKEIKEFYNEKNLADNLKTLIASGKYTDISFGENTINAITDMIEIENHGKKYKIGKFCITISCDEREIFFENLDFPKHHNNSEDSETTYEHPHVSNKIACFGNYKEHINKALVDGDYLFVLNTLIIFLKEYNDGKYGGAPFCMLEKYWGEEGDWNHEFALASRDPQCIRLVEESANRRRNYSARMLERINQHRASYPDQYTNLGDSECPNCTESEGERYAAIVCYANENCDRCSECGHFSDDCEC